MLGACVCVGGVVSQDVNENGGVAFATTHINVSLCEFCSSAVLCVCRLACDKNVMSSSS